MGGGGGGGVPERDLRRGDGAAAWAVDEPAAGECNSPGWVFVSGWALGFVRTGVCKDRRRPAVALSRPHLLAVRMLRWKKSETGGKPGFSQILSTRRGLSD